MSNKKTTIKEGAACTVSSNEIIENLQETVLEQNGRINDLGYQIFQKNREIAQSKESVGQFEKAAQHMQKQMVMSHLQERAELVARLMRIDQRLAVLGVSSPNSPDAFTLAVSGNTNLSDLKQ